MSQFEKLKNIAVVAHVDHGKTTMVDEILKQSNTFEERAEIVERVMDSGEIEKERGITITAKNCSFFYKDTKINLLDTPGHADFGGEVERSLMMVDGVLLLVDASEGPLPQTRFVLRKALSRGLKVAVIINKVDRPDQRIDEVRGECEDLLLEIATELEVEDFDIDIPFIYASAKNGWAAMEPGVVREDMIPVLDFMVSDYFPEPKQDIEAPLQLLVSNLTYSKFLGQQFVGRIHQGKIVKNQQFTCIGADKSKNFKVSNIQTYSGLQTVEVNEAHAGEIVICAGIEEVHIGDTITPTTDQNPLERIEVEPPTVAVNVSVSTSPMSGQEGEYLTSRKLEEFLQDACRLNVALKYEATDDAKVYKLKGRGELQIAIVFEELRRKGFELMVSRPEVLFQEIDGEKHEPYELAVLDVPDDFTGVVTEKLSIRKGIMSSMMPIGEGRTRIEFEIPSRGLIGYRGAFMTDTRGEGILSTEFLGYRPYAGDMLARQNGAIISDRAGKVTGYAIFNLLNNGEFFVEPGDMVYEGMVIGESKKENDANVNICRGKQLTSVRTAGKDENIILPPVRPRTLEWALDWIDNDEWVEITPQNVRIRKKELAANKRSVVRKEKK
ncbi:MULTISPECIES: translational GTPase TypA [Halobacteriovorax]|uniref:50S ribosomal subunit assembly factor BipA n=1 Tax=Halobacteriovorax vibrionivorans TaxID=2152716 RepID=A0ABY0IID1_9BACT|nr:MULTISPECIES: translational GTPase TypA [Halobacteriovorax]AYF45642.1 GTP-binding protein TypA [Halobacteriovorax sp. BALOs_7]RZF22705.1 translational GTPase TypA [Halobacteriovorax vibrionivorans]TGD46726.1 translational GTPase TypA [Halobacteriovorax sp. Y22]